MVMCTSPVSPSSKSAADRAQRGGRPYVPRGGRSPMVAPLVTARAQMRTMAGVDGEVKLVPPPPVHRRDRPARQGAGA